MKRTLFTAVAVAASLLAASVGQAATINWGSATTISADTDVINGGNANFGLHLDRAYTFGSGNTTTVNGVTFTPFPGASSDTTTLINPYPSFGGGPAPYANLSSAYQALIVGGNWNGTSESLTLTGLVVGRHYQLEVWASDSRSCCGHRNETVDGAVTLNYGIAATDGGVGQFAIGTFIADSTSQVLSFAAAESAQVNGLELRSTPEPSSLVLAGLAAVGLAVGYRRRSLRNAECGSRTDAR